MKCFNKMGILLFAVCLIVALAACSSGSDEYESLSSFEYHFYPEEYEEEYSAITRNVQLESGKDYKFLITAECKDGSITITSTYSGADDTVYFVNSNSPCNEWIELPAGTTDIVTFTANIEPITEGAIVVEILVK